MLEKIKDFFNERAEIYDIHQLNNIKDAKQFYRFVADQLPLKPKAKILDIGCGTCIELQYYFERNDTAIVDGIDIANKMLDIAKDKCKNYNLTLINENIFTYIYPSHKYDAAISIEVMHHYLDDKKISLYKKIYSAVKKDGYFILVDYFAKDINEEKCLQNELNNLIKKNKLDPLNTYHFDIPFTVQHEIECLHKAGGRVIELGKGEQTICLKCTKQ